MTETYCTKTLPPMPPSAASVRPADRYATVNGLRIHYLEWGTPGNKPLVLLHGIARVAHTFDHAAPHFARDHHVIAIDMRGHGDSDWHPQAAYLVEDYAQDVAALIDQLGLKRSVLWGASTGGRVVQVIAGARPDLAAAVIVEDVGPERPPAISARRGDRMAREEAGWASVDELVAKLKADYPRTAESLLANFARTAAKPRADGRVIWKRDPAIQKGFIPTEIWRYVEKITAPIVYILGGASTIVPPETQTRLKEVLPQVEIVTMPGLGHYPVDEDPAGFLAIVDRFLEKHLPLPRKS